MPTACIVASFLSVTETLEAAITPIGANTVANRKSGTRSSGCSVFQWERGREGGSSEGLFALALNLSHIRS
jgi:hypothetical protein